MAKARDVDGGRYRQHLDWLDDCRDEMTARLEGWAAINSGSRNLDGLARMRRVLADAFGELGASVVELPVPETTQVGADGNLSTLAHGAVLQIRLRPELRRRALLCIHYDTVYGAGHPFQRTTRLDGDRLNGPGVADAKGGILVMLYALKALERSPWRQDIGIDVLLNGDEETGSLGSGGLLAEQARAASFGLLYEPALADGTLAGARKGSGNFTLLVRGRAAHAGRAFGDGRNAIVALARAVAGLDALNGRRPALTVNAGRIAGGGPVNVVPDLAILEFNVRTGCHEDQDWLAAALDRLVQELNQLDGIRAELHGRFSRPPKPMAGRTEALFAWARSAAEAELGLTLGWQATGGCCDGNNLAAAGLPNIDTLGVRGGLIHSDQEFVHLDSLTERAKLSALLLMKAASGRLPWEAGQ